MNLRSIIPDISACGFKSQAGHKNARIQILLSLERLSDRRLSNSTLGAVAFRIDSVHWLALDKLDRKRPS